MSRNIDLLFNQSTPPSVGGGDLVLFLLSQMFGESKAVSHVHKDQKATWSDESDTFLDVGVPVSDLTISSRGHQHAGHSRRDLHRPALT